MQDKLYEKTMARAFNLLAAKPRTVAELQTRLMEKVWAEPETVARVMNRLQELGYLNDQQFAAQFATSRLVNKPLGKSRLRRDLQRKKIPTTVIDEALNEVFEQQDEDELIDRAIAKRVRLRGIPTSREEAKKLIDHLLRLGFRFDVALRKVRALAETEIESD